MLIDRLDRQVFDFFVQETMRANPGMRLDTASALVRARANADTVAIGPLQSKHPRRPREALIKSAQNLPGRKIVFFLSGGFFVENRRGDAMDKCVDITNAAAKSGVVIYSMDTRGLVGPPDDASTDRPFDPLANSAFRIIRNSLQHRMV